MNINHNSSNKQYDKLSSSVTPSGVAGRRGRVIMDKLLGRDLLNRVIVEAEITKSSYLFKRLIHPQWSKNNKVEMRKFVYTYPSDRNHPWVPTPATASLIVDLPLHGKNTWCMEALAYPRAGDDVDGPIDAGTTSHIGAVVAKPDSDAEPPTADEVERLAVIRAALRQADTDVAGGEVSEDDENDSDEDPESSDSEYRDPTYVPSSGSSSLTSSTSSLLPNPPASIETQYARLLNAIATVLATSFGMTTQQNSSHLPCDQRRFCSVFATLPIPDDGFNRKPDGVVIDGNVSPSQITWRKVIAVLEYTEQDFTLTASVTSQMHMKSYLILRRQPWRTFVLGISVAKKEFRLHYYDRSGTIISRPIDIHGDPKKLIDITATLAFGSRERLGYDPTIYIDDDLLEQQELTNPPPPSTRNALTMDQSAHHGPRQNAQIAIGWVVIPGGKRLDIMGIVWTSDGMVGRGTACYHVRDPATLQDFALKDCWVDKKSVYHETNMLNRLKNIPGVPKVAHSWTVGEEEGDVGENWKALNFAQNTLGVRRKYEPVLPKPTLLAMGNCRVHRRILMTPFASPIYAFTSVKELVWSFVTISESKFFGLRHCSLLILIIAHELMTEAGVLHQDISVNNLMIAPELIGPTLAPPSSPITPVVAATASELATPIPPERDRLRRGWIVDLDYAKLLNEGSNTSVGTVSPTNIYCVYQTNPILGHASVLIFPHPAHHRREITRSL